MRTAHSGNGFSKLLAVKKGFPLGGEKEACFGLEEQAEIIAEISASGRREQIRLQVSTGCGSQLEAREEESSWTGGLELSEGWTGSGGERGHLLGGLRTLLGQGS